MRFMRRTTLRTKMRFSNQPAAAFEMISESRQQMAVQSSIEHSLVTISLPLTCSTAG